MLVLRGIILTSAGAVLGLALALFGSRFVQGLLVNLSPADPLAFGAAALVLCAVAAAASFLPARRALRTDPMLALRSE